MERGRMTPIVSMARSTKMARTIDLTQCMSRGKGTRKYQSIYREVQGEAEIGDTLLLRDGVFLIVGIGNTWKTKTGRTETELHLKEVQA